MLGYSTQRVGAPSFQYMNRGEEREKSATQKIKFEFQKLLRHSKSEETQQENKPHLTDMIGSILAAIFKNKN